MCVFFMSHKLWLTIEIKMVEIEQKRMFQTDFLYQTKNWALDFRNGNGLNETIIWIALLYNTTILILTRFVKCLSKMTEIQFMTSMHHLPFLSKRMPNTGIQKKFVLIRKFVRIVESFETIRSHPSNHDCDLLRFIKYEEYILILSALKSSRSSSNLKDWSFYAAGDNLGGIPSWLCFRHFKLKHHLKFKNDSITRLDLLRRFCAKENGRFICYVYRCWFFGHIKTNILFWN